jgi:hypothetical protein
LAHIFRTFTFGLDPGTAAPSATAVDGANPYFATGGAGEQIERIAKGNGEGRPARL